MTKTHKLIEERINALLRDDLPKHFYSATVPLEVTAHHVLGEPIPFAEAVSREFAPFAVGTPWGRQWSTTWFRFRATVPADWKGREVTSLIHLKKQPQPGFNGMREGEGFTAEGLVFEDGIPTRALNVNRADVPVALKARGGETVDFYVEAGANASNSDYLGPNGLPSFEGPPLFTLSRAELATVNPEAYALWMDASTAFDTMKALPVESPRRGQLLFALNQMANVIDREDPETFAEARDVLREVMSRKNGPTVHEVSAVGHAHIDTAWLWPLRETVRKCARTFSTALRYIEKYPEYVFVCSQAQQYEWMKRHYPTIHEDIKKAVKSGQWEPVGAMWIEADCNIPSGEALVRQIVYGKRYFRDELGFDCRNMWIPDVFGYAASFPQILKKAEIDYFLTQKISWSQFNKFPHHTFLWRGIDGTDIFTHFPPADTYNAAMKPKELIESVARFRENDRATRSLYVYGYGDGGGGPSIEQVERARRMRDLEGVPKVTPERVDAFFPKAEADAKELPVWFGELYLELHRGTLTTQGRNKRGNRKGEFLLRDAEFLAGLDPAAVRGRLDATADIRPVPAQDVYDATPFGSGLEALLTRAWKLLLLNQFHDIIPGSSITWVYRDSDRDYENVGKLGAQVREAGLDVLAGGVDTAGMAEPVALVNTLAFPRREVVSLPDGREAWVEAPSAGYVVADVAVLENTPLPEGLQPVSVEPRAEGGFVLKNGLVTVEIGADGLVHRVYDERARREALAPGQKGNLFQLHSDYPNSWDAWDVDVHYRDTFKNWEDVTELGIEAAGPLRCALRLVKKTAKSTLTQKIVLSAGSARLDFVTEVEWYEKKRLLKVGFPLNIHTTRAWYEIQYGHVDRPTHTNTTWDEARFEVCGQKWGALQETGYGVALLNDCKYGYDALGNVLRLSLLRGPVFPDPHADEGRHEFTYSLFPYQGDLYQGRVIEEAYALNVPLLQKALPTRSETPVTAGIRQQSYFSFDRPGVILEVVKPADDGDGVIARFYEAYGARGPVTLSTTLPFKRAEFTNLLEEAQGDAGLKDGALTLEIKPFEIVTVRFSG